MPEATTGHKRRFCLRSTLRKDDAQSAIHRSRGKLEGGAALITGWKRTSF